MEWQRKGKKFGKHKQEGKVDLSSQHGFEVFIRAVQALTLVNAWQTLRTQLFLAYKSLGMLCT
jgi:hypothetical protein